jgi:hypothetical protein
MGVQQQQTSANRALNSDFKVVDASPATVSGVFFDFYIVDGSTYPAGPPDNTTGGSYHARRSWRLNAHFTRHFH